MTATLEEQEIRVVESTLVARERELSEQLSMLRKTLNKLRGQSIVSLSLSGSDSRSNSWLTAIIESMKEDGEWMSLGDIRRRTVTLRNRDLPDTTLRHYLVKYENQYFMRQGNRRTTKWKLSDSVVP